MATFFVQTDKDFYFAGETVNGNIFINVSAMIVGAQGLSLKFTGYECVKWLEATEMHRPQPRHHRPGHPPPPPQFDPIAAVPAHLWFNTDNLTVSDCESEENREFDHRPRYIRTSQGRHYEMKYYETRNMFTRSKSMVYQCSGFPPGQYSFPFSFKTFEGWPASFNYYSPQKKGIIIYHMVAAIQPVSPQFKIQGGRQIILRQTRVVQSQQRQSSGAITSCCCINKGATTSNMSFAKDGFMPGEMVQMIIEVDNSQCSANVKTISISVTNQVTMRSQGHSTSVPRTFFTKTINGLNGGESLVGEKAIRDQFMMPLNPEIKPTCSGKLLSSNYSLNIMLHHDISCQCCSDRVGSGIPIIIFPVIPIYNMPALFQNNWAPKVMPMTNMVLPNNFGNFNLNAMGAAMAIGPPPPAMNQPMMNQPQQQMPMPPQQQMQMQTPMNPNMGMNVSMGQPNNMGGGTNMNVSVQTSGMGMNPNMGMNQNFGMNPNNGMTPNNGMNFQQQPPGGF